MEIFFSYKWASYEWLELFMLRGLGQNEMCVMTSPSTKIIVF